jgi:3-oxoacyl-[acyl-carrier-protein] synthase I
MEVYIAGKGIISAIGLNVQETLQSLKTGKSGISTQTNLAGRRDNNLPTAEIHMTNKELASMAGLNESYSRTALLSMIAARQALNDSRIDVNDFRTGFISATTVGGMDKTEKFLPAFITNGDLKDIDQILYHDSGSITEIVAEELGIKNFVSTISTACSSSANSIMYASRLIKTGVLDVAIAGGTDAMSLFTLSGFNALMILDENPCTPYDDNRKGLNLGEGAGYVVLVSERVAEGLTQKPVVKLVGYANANDAFHQTASSPEGKGNYLAMQGALKMSGLEPGQIDYINLHGTGTANNDLSEGMAIQRIFGDKVPKSSSTKPYTGHTLGACGGIEAIFSIMTIEEKLIFPSLRLRTPMKELNFVPVTVLTEGIDVKHVLSNSFGFGGNCSSLIFSKVN